MLFWKKLNFDLLTPFPGSGEVGEGVGEEKVNNFSVMLGHLTLYWAILAKRLCPIPHSQTTKPPNHQESINVRIRGELYFFNPFVMFYDSVIKLQIFAGFGGPNSLRCKITINKLKKRSQISWEYAKCGTNWARINRNPRRRDFLSPRTTNKKSPPMLRGGGGQFQNECSSFFRCGIDPATWESKTATYIAWRTQLR